MSLYDHKSKEMLKDKILGFKQSFKIKTGAELSKEEMILYIKDLYAKKILQHMTLAFESETAPSLKTLIDNFDDIFDQNQVDDNDSQLDDELEQAEPIQIQSEMIKKRGRKPKT